MALTPEEIARVRGAAFTQNRVASTSPITGETVQGLAVRTAPISSGPQSGAPPTAIDAPSKGQNNIFVGLCEALNQHQKQLEKQFPGYVADEYVINFAPVSVGDSSVVKPDLVYKNTAGKNTKTAQDVVDSNKDSVNTKSQNWNVLAGTQIVQLIDQVMRSSSYITGQQLVTFDEDGKQSANKTAGTSGVTAWYKISLSAQQLKYDTTRRDHAYRMIFTISPYAINQMASPYFPDSNYRGAHKAYNYWFTGANTQVLNYEQDYNQSYYVTLTGNPEALASAPPTGRDQFKKTYMATSEQRGQGQANYVNEPADSAASFLYSVADFAEVRLKIVGDPAWMQQGEASFGVNAKTFDFKPFNSDGGINYDSQEVVFTVSFSRPTDYNLSTGIMNTNSTGAPQETFAYIAKSCKNVFSKGSFTQELVGSLLPLTDTPNRSNVSNGRTVTPNNTTSRTSTQIQQGNNIDPQSTLSQGEEIIIDPESTLSPGEEIVNELATPQSSPPPEDPTSSGDINVFSTVSLGEEIFGEQSTPQLIARDD